MVSTMSSGPFPPHPYYDKSGTDPRMYLDIPNPRVRPEAKQIYSQAQGTVGMVLQIEGQRVQSAYGRQKPQPKDHVSANVRRMRQIQRQTRKKELEKVEDHPKPVKALWKSNKYDNVQSKVLDELSKTPPAPRPSSAGYLRAHSRTGFVPQSARSASLGCPQSARSASSEPPEEELTVPKAQSAREVKLIRRELDFIQLNGRGVKNTHLRKSPSMGALHELKKWQEEDLQKHKKGQVPKYLQLRKQEWKDEEDERLKNIPDPDMPEGHRLMDESERRETLGKLKQTEKELQSKIASLPVRTDTVRMKRQKDELETKMQEVEEAIKIFSRRKVFVKLDD